MRAATLIVLMAISGAAVQQAAALRRAEAFASPLLAYPWMPWKDENNQWHQATIESPDFSQMTLSDLPAPELYLQVALTSPYAVPLVPLEKVINNTIAHISDTRLPTNAKRWVQMASNAGNLMTKNMPLLMQKAVQMFAEGITVGGQPLASGLQENIDASKALKALPQLLNITMIGMDASKISAIAKQLDIKVPPMSNELNESIEQLKKLPALMQLPKDGLTLDEIRRLPEVLEQIATTTTNAADAFAKQLQALQFPNLGELIDDKGTKMLRSFLQSQVNIDIPAGAPVEKVIVNITKAIPAIATQLGINIEGLDKLPSIIESLEKAFTVAKKEGLVETDGAGRIDVSATLTSLPGKVPKVHQVVSNIVPPVSDLPQVQKSLDRLQKAISRLADMSADIMSMPKRSALGIRHV